MNINKITPNINFQNTKNETKTHKPEFIDKFVGLIQNQNDVNDCVAVPRGIFKAYLWIMSGFGLLSISGALPQKWKGIKTSLSIIGNICNIISAFYFAKPFAFKGVSPTIKLEKTNN
jgi:hypothetical protein